MRSLRLICGAAGAALLLAAPPARAHALGAECKLVGQSVEVEAYYDDDTPAGNARVSVLDEKERPLVEGRTNAKGCWSFPRPGPGKYQVVVDAGSGHRTTVKITIPGVSAAADVQPGSAEASPGPGASREAPVVLNDGPSRKEFTRSRWPQAALGVGALGALGLAFWLAARKRGRGGSRLTGAPSSNP